MWKTAPNFLWRLEQPKKKHVGTIAFPTLTEDFTSLIVLFFLRTNKPIRINLQYLSWWATWKLINITTISFSYMCNLTLTFLGFDFAFANSSSKYVLKQRESQEDAADFFNFSHAIHTCNSLRHTLFPFYSPLHKGFQTLEVNPAFQDSLKNLSRKNQHHVQLKTDVSWLIKKNLSR